MKNKSKKTINTKQLFVGALAVFMFAGGIKKAHAEIREGIVVDKRSDGLVTDVWIRVDMTRPYDHIIRLQRSYRPGSTGHGLDMMIERGSVIVFDDQNMGRQGVTKFADSERWIVSVDGVSVLDMFPEQGEYFWFAREHERNSQREAEAAQRRLNDGR